MFEYELVTSIPAMLLKAGESDDWLVVPLLIFGVVFFGTIFGSMFFGVALVAVPTFAFFIRNIYAILGIFFGLVAMGSGSIGFGILLIIASIIGQKLYRNYTKGRLK